MSPSYERESSCEIDARPLQPLELPSTARTTVIVPATAEANDRERHGQRRERSALDFHAATVNSARSEHHVGFAPSRDLYGVDGSESSSTGPIANAYPEAGSERRPTAAASFCRANRFPSTARETKSCGRTRVTFPATTAPQTSVTLAPPPNLYTLAEGWDGGVVPAWRDSLASQSKRLTNLHRGRTAESTPARL